MTFNYGSHNQFSVSQPDHSDQFNRSKWTALRYSWVGNSPAKCSKTIIIIITKENAAQPHLCQATCRRFFVFPSYLSLFKSFGMFPLFLLFHFLNHQLIDNIQSSKMAGTEIKFYRSNLTVKSRSNLIFTSS